MEFNGDKIIFFQVDVLLGVLTIKSFMPNFAACICQRWNLRSSHDSSWMSWPKVNMNLPFLKLSVQSEERGQTSDGVASL